VIKILIAKIASGWTILLEKAVKGNSARHQTSPHHNMNPIQKTFLSIKTPFLSSAQGL